MGFYQLIECSTFYHYNPKKQKINFMYTLLDKYDELFQPPEILEPMFNFEK